MKRRVLFHRSWTKFNGGTSGGQIKVRDAYNHVLSSELFEPHVFYGPETEWFDNPGNVWLDLKEAGIPEWNPTGSDLIFFSGHDWKVMKENERRNPMVPVINIAQPRQTMLPDARKDYLRHPAIRIVKSTIAKKILEDYGVNGPIYYIPDAIDFSLLPAPNPNPDIDILIVGLKNPGMAQQLQKKIKRANFWSIKKLKVEIQIPPKLPTRMDFINLLNRCKIAVFLPLDEERGAEGFYLPALEGMALQKLVVCPYAVGNVDFCIDNETCIMPEYTLDQMYQGIKKALRLTSQQKNTIIEKASKIKENHTIEKERASIINLLENANDIWNQKSLFDI